MINLQLQAERVMHGLALHRFHVHQQEVERVLQPILEEVYRFGVQKGVADSCNNIFVTDPEPIENVEQTQPVGTIEAQVEVIRHEPAPPEDTLETENIY